ncbi:MAG TPA: serine hydrolase [Azoarcus sp.]|nr:serine hydrolase [Azoarcus sp.]
MKPRFFAWLIGCVAGAVTSFGALAAGPFWEEFPELHSASYMVVHERTGAVLFEQNATQAVPIASITKLMTAMVVLDANQRLSERITVTDGDIDHLKKTRSRLAIGATLTREEMLHIMLMSSENRAASALARNYPGGAKAFIQAMNIKARMLGLTHTRFADSSGLNPGNVSSPSDLARLVSVAATYPLIRNFSTSPERYVKVGGKTLHYRNSNSLVREGEWRLGLSKTGYIREAGRCLVMQTWVGDEPVVMVLLNASDTWARTTDARHVKERIASVDPAVMAFLQ